jgi:hypothetical protein
MASRNRTLQFAVTGSLLALAPVAPVDSCSAAALGDPSTAGLADVGVEDPAPTHPDRDPVAPFDRLRARDGGPVVNPGPVPSAE